MNKYALSDLCPGDGLATPAPVLQGVTVCSLGDQRHQRVWSAKLDTGADRTAIPVQICQDLGMAPRSFAEPSGFDRSVRPRRVPVHYVQIEVPGFAAVTLRVYAVKRQSILLGRDYLEEMVFLLHPHHSWFALGPWTPLRGALSNVLSWV